MTISLDLAARIERLYTVEHWRVGTIARQLHVHRDTVRRVLREHEVVPPGAPLRQSLIDPYRVFIGETLEKYPTLTASRLHDMVCERGYAGQASHFRHIVSSIRPRPAAEAYLRLRTLAGEQAQVDWGLCRARHRPHYAESPNMPSICPSSQIAGRRPRRAARETRHSLDAYRFFRKVSNASSGLKVDGVECACSNAHQTAPMPIGVGQTLAEGAEVSTEPGGVGVLRFADGQKLALASNSSVRRPFWSPMAKMFPPANYYAAWAKPWAARRV